jgi:uncharacterized protein (DUF1697 family)
MPKTRYVAFLRAINVGKRTVRMELLRSLFEALEFSTVETFIASGNVIFQTSARDTTKLQLRIEAHLRESLGFEVETFLRSSAELAIIAACKPFGEVEGQAVHVGFLSSPLDPGQTRALMALESENDRLRVIGRDLYWLCQTKVSESKLIYANLGKILGVPVTMRNLTTIRKLVAKYSET